MRTACLATTGLSVVLALSATLTAATVRAFECTTEDALVEAAVELVVQSRAPTSRQLQRALHQAGSDLPSARAIRVRPGDAEGLTAFISRIRERADGPLVCGEASTSEARLLLVGIRAGTLREEPGSVGFTLAPGFRDAHLVVRDATGELHRLHPELRAAGVGALRVNLPRTLQRPLELQLVATGPDGPRPVAQRVLGSAGPSTLPSDTDGDDDLAARVSAIRSMAGVRTLRSNRVLVAEAETHAARVCRDQRVRHGAGEEDPEQRLRTRGLVARVVGETVARGPTLREALRVLSASPSHRMTMIDARFTDVGYGSSEVGGHTCVVALFAAWPRFVGRVGRVSRVRGRSMGQ